MIDLEPYVGKRCLVQFAGGDHWLVVHADDRGHPSLVGFVEKQGESPRPVPFPFLTGDIVKMGNGFALRFEDENRSKLQVGLNPEKLLTVVIVTEVNAPSKIVLA